VDQLPEPDDGLVSLAEFRHLALHGKQHNLKSSALWSSVREVSCVAVFAVRGLLQNVHLRNTPERLNY
jgi:hypothetical protein